MTRAPGPGGTAEYLLQVRLGQEGKFWEGGALITSSCQVTLRPRTDMSCGARNLCCARRMRMTRFYLSQATYKVQLSRGIRLSECPKQ